jgi:surfeit locus 1 family protein
VRSRGSAAGRVPTSPRPKWLAPGARPYPGRVAKARFLLHPRWLLSHLFVILLVVTMVNLGFWQLRRLEEKRDRNALVEARAEMPVVPVEDLLAPGDGDAEVGAARFREVTAAGTFDEPATVVVRNRSQDGVAGAWLVTPVELGGGARVGVLRGFVPLGADGTAFPAPVAAGEVTVEGMVVDPGSFDGTAPGDLAPLLAADGVLPGLVLATSSTPPEPAAAGVDTASREVILPVPPPELSEGPHLSYAVQWFIFSTIAVVGYPLVLRRVVARRGKEVDDTDDDADDAADDEAGPPAEAAGHAGRRREGLDAELDTLLRQEG